MATKLLMVFPEGKQPQPVFASRTERDRFRADFARQIRPALDRIRVARAESEIWARTRYVA